MDKNISKLLSAGLLALSAGFVLAACDPVSASPSNYKDPIVVKTADGSKVDFEENLVGNLYDSIASERNSKVVSKILEAIAEERFGSYHELLGARADAAKKADFIKKDYFGNNETRFEQFCKDIDLRLSEYFYNQMSSGSYNDDLGRFSEEKFYKACKYELYDMAELTDEVRENKFFLDASITKENAFGQLKGVYHNEAEKARGYIEEKVYPDILKDILVEDYIYEKNSSSLGRAYARKVSYVKIQHDDSFTHEKALMQEFADKYIKNAGAINETNKEEIKFELLNSAVKGYGDFDVVDGLNHYLLTSLDSASDAGKLATAAYGAEVISVPASDDYVYEDYILVEPGDYVKESKLGQILESYQKGLDAVGDRFAPEEAKNELAKFTSDGKSKEYGLMQKLLSLAKEDYTTDGWYVKNGGITELPSALRDRLFNIRVANTLDTIPAEETEGVYTKSNYLRNISGRKVILPSGAAPYSDTEPFNYIYHDVSGKAFYIVQVLEAPSTGKLESEDFYDAAEKELISREIAKVLGTKDSYVKDAYTSYLDKYTFEFFDSSLYDYFKSEYPDLSQFNED